MGKYRPRIGRAELKPTDYNLSKERQARVIKALEEFPYLTREYICAVTRLPDNERTRKGLYTMTLGKNPILYRPTFQLNSMYLYRKMIFGLTNSKQPQGEHFLHGFMRSCAGGSVKAAVERHGWEWLPFDAPRTFTILDGQYTPDDVWRWRTDTGRRTYLFEADRGTKDLRGEKRSTIEAKLKYQDELFNDADIIESMWGEHGVKSIKAVLTLTVNRDRMLSMIELVKEKSMYPERYLFKALPGFFQTDGWSIPSVRYDLFDEPWEGVNGAVYLNK